MLDIHPPKTGLMTVDEFLEWVNLPENADKRWELIEGVPVEMPPSSKVNTIIAMLIGSFLNMWILDKNLGYVTGADGGYQMSKHSSFQPDVAYISHTQVNGLEGNIFDNPPSLAVEVISPSERPRKIMQKIETYLASGTILVWIVYPEEKVVDVWRSMSDGSLNKRKFEIGDILSGEDVLPNFTLEVAKIFPHPPTPNK